MFSILLHIRMLANSKHKMIQISYLLLVWDCSWASHHVTPFCPKRNDMLRYYTKYSDTSANEDSSFRNSLAEIFVSRNMISRRFL